MFRGPYVTTFLLILAFLTTARGSPSETDSLLSAALEGSNKHPVWNVALEGITLLTPVVEIGWTLRQAYRGRSGPDPYAAETSRLAAGSLLITQAAVAVLKYAIRRERPVRNYRPRLWNTRITPSFPSGHAASSAAFATIAAARSTRSTLAVTAYALVSVYSQVYVGNHYLGDVLAGALVGVAVGKWMLSRSGGNGGNDGAVSRLILPPLRISIPLRSR